MICVFWLLAPGDYTSLTQTLIFDSDNSQRTVQFDITDDNIDEELEMFQASLSLDPSETSNVQIRPDLTTVNIVDNDRKKLV